MNRLQQTLNSKQKFKNSEEFCKSLSSLHDILLNLEAGSSLKVIDFLCYLTCQKGMSKDLESCYLITTISMIAVDLTRGLEADPSVPSPLHPQISVSSQLLTKIYLQSEPKMKISTKVTRFHSKLLSDTRTLIRDSLVSCGAVAIAKLRLLSMIMCLSASTPLALTLLSLKNLVAEPVLSEGFPRYTNKQAPFLPEYNRKQNTLVLDLDETLVHYSAGAIRIRPGAAEFITKMNESYELVLFTAGTPAYADAVMALIDQNNCIKLRLYREHTTVTGKIPIKNLESLGRDLNRVIIVDNFRESFMMQPYNGICIDTWVGCMNDSRLSELGLKLEKVPELQFESVIQIIPLLVTQVN